MSTDATAETIEQAYARYKAAMHGMQAGVATKMGFDPSETTPKHLRVGINGAMSDYGALVKLLIDRGVFTNVEYAIAIADGAERERAMYEKELTDHFGGVQIHLAGLNPGSTE